MDRHYTVEGRWPFPLDMLRHDQARPATPADKDLIDKFSGETAFDCFDERGRFSRVRINLIMEAGESTKARPGGRWLPNADRWASFDWRVEGVAEIEDLRALDCRMREQQRLRKSALAKLTLAEREALGLADDEED